MSVPSTSIAHADTRNSSRNVENGAIDANDTANKHTSLKEQSMPIERDSPDRRHATDTQRPNLQHDLEHVYPPVIVHHGTRHNSVQRAVQETPSAAADVSAKATTSPTHVSQYIRRKKTIMQFAAVCLSLFLAGWNDGSTGPLLPVVQRDYHVGFAIVALLFVANCVGFISAAFANVWMDNRYGMGQVIVLGAAFQLAAYAILAPAPPFPFMVLAYGFNGFGMSLQSAQANGFVASVKDHMSLKLGMMHAIYGIGAFTSPFAATHFSMQKHWSFHYLLSAAIAFADVAFLLFVFRLKRQEDILAEAGHLPSEESRQHTTESANSQRGLYRQILSLKAVHFMALFLVIYEGVEVTLGGWIVTFIIQKRAGGSNAGFISSGFFGGLTLGRLGLLWLNKLIGERRVVFIYTLLCIGFEITVWLVPSIVQNAVAVSLIGVLLGPMYPIVVSHATKLLPGWLLTGSVGLITSIGISGSAFVPFLTGLLASKYGIGSLQPLMVSMMSLMIVMWTLVPKAVRRID